MDTINIPISYKVQEAIENLAIALAEENRILNSVDIIRKRRTLRDFDESSNVSIDFHTPTGYVLVKVEM